MRIAAALAGIAIGALALTTAPAYADVASEHGLGDHGSRQGWTSGHHGSSARNHHWSGTTGSFKPRHAERIRPKARIGGFRATPDRVHRGDRLNLHGTLRSHDDHGHRFGRERIHVYFRPNGSSDWRRIDTIATRSNGTFSTQTRAYRSGTWSVRYNGGRLGNASAYDYVRLVG